MSPRWGGGKTSKDTEEWEEFLADTDHALWEVLKSYGWRRKWWFILGSISGLISRSMDLIPPLLLAVAIDAIFFDEQAFNLPLVSQAALPDDVFWQFSLLIGLLVAIYILEAALLWLKNFAWGHLAIHIQHELRVDTFDAMQAMEMEFFDNKQTGQVMSVLNNDVNQLEGFLRRNVDTGIRIFVAVFGTFTAMMLLNWQLTLIAVVPIPLLAIASFYFVKIIKPKYVDVRSKVGRVNAQLENNVTGIEVVKAFTNEDLEHDRIEAASQDHLDANWSAIKTRIKFFPTLNIITGIGYLLIFSVGGFWVVYGPYGPFTLALSAGVLVAFLQYSQRFMWPMRQLGQIIDQYQYAEAAAQRVYGLIHSAEQIPEKEDAHELAAVDGEITFRDVDFTYKFEDEFDRETVIQDVSFDIEAGDYVGIVGPTGAGKTTLIKLLMRFYDVDRGSIQVDSHDIRDVTVESLRESIGYVSQDPFLFDGTIGENVAYAHPDAHEEEIIRAAELAGAWDFIRELPDGLDTRVGERGVKLSGGQRQRVSLARAIMKDPAVLVLDEATSHVDNETEVLIKNSLNQLIAERTTFAIAHRLSTVRNADTILVMDDGRLVEEGTHEELLELDGLYANLWRVQVGEMDALPQEFIDRTRERRAQLDTDDD